MKPLTSFTPLLITLSVGTTACSSLGLATADANHHESNEADLAVAEICETDLLIHRLYRRNESEPIAAMATYNKETRRDVGFFSIEKFGPQFIESARKGADCGPPKMTARAGVTTVSR